MAGRYGVDDEWVKNQGLIRTEMMTGVGWQVWKSNRCRGRKNEGTPCSREGDRAEHLLGMAKALTGWLISAWKHLISTLNKTFQTF